MRRPDLARFEARARLVAAVVVAASLLALVVLAQWAPDAPGASDDRADLDPGLYQALQTILASLLTVGVISLLWEAFLKQVYARDLSRFLKLRASTVRTALQDVMPEDELDWSDLLGRATTVRVLLANPMVWLPQHQRLLLAAARRQAVDVVVGVPDEDGAHFPAVAQACGMDPDRLKAAIATANQSLEQGFDGDTEVRVGSSFEVRTFDGLLAYDTVVTEDAVILLLGAPRPAGPQSRRLAVTFARVPDGGYPALWLASQLNAALDARTPIMKRERQP